MLTKKQYFLLISKRLILLFIIVTVFFMSCKRSEYPGYTEADSGLIYKIHIDNKGVKAKTKSMKDDKDVDD